MTRRLGDAIRGVVVIALTATLTAAIPAEAAPARPPTLTWTTCPPDPNGAPVDPRLRCTTLRVPMDYRAPAGRTIEIAVSRLATAKPGLRRGILLHNAGGPGAASLNRPSTSVGLYPRDVLDRFDLIGFDPRGLGYSTPITCGRTTQITNERLFPYPAPDGSIADNVDFARELARDCLANGGALLPHVTTANTARDMDRIRIALGERKLSYLSASYGSYLGAVYAELFPDRTDRIVLDANVDPNVTWHERWASWDHGFDTRFGDFAAWAAERHDTLGLGATPAAVRRGYLDMVERLDRSPVQHPGAGPVTGNLFRAIYQAYSYHTLQFPEVAAWWRFLAGTGPPPQWGEWPSTPGIPRDNDTAVLLAVTCGDSRAPRDIAHYWREATVNRALFPILGGMGTNIWPCAFWPDPVEPAVRITDRGATDILLLQTTRDPATPYPGALSMRSALGKRARMITVDGGNHGAYDPEAPSCAVTRAHDFLSTGALPARDLFCFHDPAPAQDGNRLPYATLHANRPRIGPF
ncbi:alpha/beta hydrolase [Embleya sp. NPDC020886]|uniref:alpha/beta hydrolase n=1 Tax=Embleya sp. NPDC020886 TaxID=3363980 RepID=UPI00378E1F7A